MTDFSPGEPLSVIQPEACCFRIGAACVPATAPRGSNNVIRFAIGGLLVSKRNLHIQMK
jgi:hypothetical protein